MAFRIAPLQIPQGGVDYSAETRAAQSLFGALGQLPAQFKQAQQQQTLGELGRGVANGTIDAKQAAGKLFELGKTDTAFDMLKLSEATAQRKAGEEATRDLGKALQGYLGVPGLGASPTASPASSTGPTGSALPAALNASESGGNWGAQNNEVGAGGARGHFGRAQFGQARLQEAANAGAIPQGTTPDQFMRSPELQKAAENWHFGDIDNFIAQRGYNQAVGQNIAGVPITLDGMRNVAHLGGKEGLRKFIETGGQYNPSDANGTSLMDYLRMGARSAGGRTAAADAPAPGSANASYESGSDGFAIPGGSPAMSGRTFAQITNGMGNQPLRPAFEAEGVSQPWMGTALQRAPGLGGPVAVSQVQPPPRPYDLRSDQPAPGAVQALGQFSQAYPLANTADPTADNAGILSGLVASEEARRGLPSGAGIMSPWDNFRGQPQPTPADGNFSGARTAQTAAADLPARGATPAIGTMPPSAVGVPAQAGAAAQPADNARTEGAASPVPSTELPKPTNAQEVQEFRWTRQVEAKQRELGALTQILANPNLPANARGLGEIFLKEGLEQSRMPESAKEFIYARGMGWTNAKNLAEYNAEKEKAKKNTADDDVQARQAAAARAGLKPGDAGYQGFILTGKMPREDMGPLTATDKKAILEADEAVQSAQTAIKALQDAKKLSPQALGGWGASSKAAIANNLPDWMVPDRFVASPQQGEATANLDNLVTSQALAQLKSIFGAAPTEGERKILLDIQGSVGQPDNIRQQIYDRAIQMAERRLAFNQQRASELRGGDFYKSPEKRGQGGGQPSPQGQAQPQQGSAPMQGAKQAPDGNWYVADPNRPGKFLRVN